MNMKLIYNAFINPFKIMNAKPDEKHHLNYSIGIAPIPNKTNWIVGAILNIVLECKLTKLTSEYQTEIFFQEKDALYNFQSTDDEEVKSALMNQTLRYTNLPNILLNARQTINTQINIESMIVYGVSILLIIASALIGSVVW